MQARVFSVEGLHNGFTQIPIYDSSLMNPHQNPWRRVERSEEERFVSSSFTQSGLTPDLWW